MDRALNLVVALACQGSPLLDSLTSLGAVQTALSPLQTFAANLDHFQEDSESPHKQATPGRDEQHDASQIIVARPQTHAASDSGASPAPDDVPPHAAPAQDVLYNHRLHGAPSPVQHPSDSEAADAGLSGSDEGLEVYAPEADMQQPVTSAIADSALRLLEVSLASPFHTSPVMLHCNTA